MGLIKEALAQRLQHEGYPRASAYDPEWVLEYLMGPNVLWLAEALSQKLELRPGMRVLDMGCGKAMSSIFLAKEFGIQVWATEGKLSRLCGRRSSALRWSDHPTLRYTGRVNRVWHRPSGSGQVVAGDAGLGLYLGADDLCAWPR